MMFKGPKSKTHQGIPIQRACDGVSFLTNTKEAFGQSLPYGCWRQLVLIVRESLAVLESAGPHLECCSTSCVEWQERAAVLREKEIRSTAGQGLKQFLVTLYTKVSPSGETLCRVYAVKNYTSHKNKSGQSCNSVAECLPSITKALSLALTKINQSFKTGCGISRSKWIGYVKNINSTVRDLTGTGFYKNLKSHSQAVPKVLQKWWDRFPRGLAGLGP